MEPIAVILHLFLAFILITLILIQKGKGAGMGAAFGSGSSQTLFGSKGSLGFIVKLTIFIAALFFATSIALTYIASQAARKAEHQNTATELEKIAEKIEKEIPIISPPSSQNPK